MIRYVLSGVLMILASPLVNAWPLIFVALAPALLGFWRDAGCAGLTNSRLGPSPSPWRNLLGGYLVGLCYAVSHFYWLADFKPLWLLPVLASFALMPALLGLAVWLAARSGLRGFGLLLWSALSWVAIEVLGSDLLLDLPSYALGYYLWQAPLLLQLADITGVFGISLWIIAVNVLLAQCWQARGLGSLPWWLVTVVLSALVLGYGGFRQATVNGWVEAGDTLQVQALHTAVTISEKHDDDATRRLFEEFTALTREAVEPGAAPAALTVWPETSLPLWLRSAGHRHIVQQLLQVTSDTGTPVLVGAHAVTRSASRDPQVFNSAFLVPAAGYIAEEYRKVKLVPGAEYNPLAPWLPPGLRSRWPSRMTPGTRTEPLALSQHALGVSICWEAFFPEHMRTLTAQGAQLLVNMSNDEAAFGPLQRAYNIPLPHLVLRAVENRRFLVRSANGGSSLFIAPTGEIVEASLPATTGILPGQVVLLSNETFWVRHGFVFARAVLAVWLMGWVVLALRTSLRH